jgi:hypothetical protein
MTPQVLSKTCLREKLEARELALEQSQETDVQKGALMLGIGAIAAFVFARYPVVGAFLPVGGRLSSLLFRVSPDFADQLARVLGYLASAFFVVVACLGVKRLVSGARTQVRSIACPRCGTKHPLPERIRKTICPQCALLTILGDTDTEATMSFCGYCGLAVAVSEHSGDFRCSKCGSLRNGTATPGMDILYPCEACGKAIPADPVICIYCGKSYRDIYVRGKFTPGFDMDWLGGKDAAAHRQFAEATLEAFDKTIPETGGALADLEMVLLCLEEAYAGDQDVALCDQTLKHLESTYLKFLEAELDILRTTGGQRYSTGTWDPYVKLPYLKVRRSLEARLKPTHPNMRVWGDELIKVTWAGEGTEMISSWVVLQREIALQRQYLGLE